MVAAVAMLPDVSTTTDTSTGRRSMALSSGGVAVMSTRCSLVAGSAGAVSTRKLIGGVAGTSELGGDDDTSDVMVEARRDAVALKPGMRPA